MGYVSEKGRSIFRFSRLFCGAPHKAFTPSKSLLAADTNRTDTGCYKKRNVDAGFLKMSNFRRYPGHLPSAIRMPWPHLGLALMLTKRRSTRKSRDAPLRRRPMPSSSIQMVLWVSAIALFPAAAQPVSGTTPKPSTETSNSTLDVPIEDIAASPNGCAVLDKDFPGLRKHAMYGFFKSMSLHQIAALSKGRLTPDMMAQARTDLSTLSFAVAQPAHQEDIDDLDPAPRHDQVSLGSGHPK